MTPFNMQVLQLPAKQLLALTFNQGGFHLYLSKMAFVNQLYPRMTFNHLSCHSSSTALVTTDIIELTRLKCK